MGPPSQNKKTGSSSFKVSHLLGFILLFGSLAVNIYLLYPKLFSPLTLNSSPSASPQQTSALPIFENKVEIATHDANIQQNVNNQAVNSPLRSTGGSKKEVHSSEAISKPETTASTSVTEREEDRKPSAVITINESPNPSKSTQNMLSNGRRTWESFLQMERQTFETNANTGKGFLFEEPPIICSAAMQNKLAAPQLPKADFDWCQWALSSSGGGVMVGKSWGKLKKDEKQKFDQLNCNAVSSGKNPSCDDSWGDAHINTWKKTLNEQLQCDVGRPSQMECFSNVNKDVYCSLKNAMIDFSKVQKVSRPGNTPSKKFEHNFISADCKADKMEPSFPFPHLYSPELSTKQCDYVYNGTLLMFSHDDIRNLGHTLNDIMNVWVLMWLNGIARHAKSVDMLNIDSFKLGHNFDDNPNVFFTTYRKALRSIMKGVDFQGKTLCVKDLLIQPTPPRFFIWESWFVNLPCSFVGPSTLYQRWNLHVRQEYNLLNKANTDKFFQILLIVRNEHSNMWGNQRTSRNYLNLPEISAGMHDFVNNLGSTYKLVVQDLSKLSFEEQLRLIAESSIIIGTHGAGIASSMHMSIGSKYCCGVLEIYPQGEFFPILGHGNMARKMGLHYDRLDLSAGNSKGDGAIVPVSDLVQKTKEMVDHILNKPTCIVKPVLDNPYLE